MVEISDAAIRLTGKSIQELLVFFSSFLMWRLALAIEFKKKKKLAKWEFLEFTNILRVEDVLSARGDETSQPCLLKGEE